MDFRRAVNHVVHMGFHRLALMFRCVCARALVQREMRPKDSLKAVLPAAAAAAEADKKPRCSAKVVAQELTAGPGRALPKQHV